MNKNIKILISLLLVISLISSYIIKEKNIFALNLGKLSKIEEKEDILKYVEKEMQNIVDKFNLASLSISVVENNNIFYSKGFGYANIDKNIKTDTDTIYRIASISKTIIASSIMKLYEEGKFKLDDDINGYLNGFEVRNPNFPNDKITFKMLLTHTSSIIDGNTYSDIYDIQNFGDYKPGDKFEYSNYAYNLLATLVEQISNKDFEDFVQQYLFKPLNIKASFNPKNFDNIDDIAVLYNVDEEGNLYESLNDKKNIENNIVIKPTYRDKHGNIPLGNAFKYFPTGGLRISTNELAKFMIMLSNNGVYNGTRVLKKETIDLMNQIHWHGDSFNGLYKYQGLGLHITDDLMENSRLIGHTGEAYGLLSNMFYDKSSGFGYIIMINGNSCEFDEDGFTKVEKEIVNIIEENFNKDKDNFFDINIENTNTIISNNRAILLEEKIKKINNDYMISAINFADIFNIKIFKENSNIKLANKDIEITINTDKNGRIPLNKTAKELEILYSIH